MTVPVDEDIVEVKVHDEVNQLLLDAGWGSIPAVAIALAREHANGVQRLSVGHIGVVDVLDAGS